MPVTDTSDWEPVESSAESDWEELPLDNVKGVNLPSQFSSGLPASVPISQNPDWAFTQHMAQQAAQGFPELSKPFKAIPSVEIKPDDSKAVAVGKEVYNLVKGIPEFIESPLGIATLPVAAEARGAKILAGLFGATTFKDVGQQLMQANDNWDNYTPAQKAAAITDIAGKSAFGAFLTRSAFGKGHPLKGESDALSQQSTAGGNGNRGAQSVEAIQPEQGTTENVPQTTSRLRSDQKDWVAVEGEPAQTSGELQQPGQEIQPPPQEIGAANEIPQPETAASVRAQPAANEAALEKPADVVRQQAAETPQENAPEIEPTTGQPIPVIAGVEPDTIAKGIRVEAQDHPEVARQAPQLLPEIVKDELAIDKKAYDGDKDPMTSEPAKSVPSVTEKNTQQTAAPETSSAPSGAAASLFVRPKGSNESYPVSSFAEAQSKYNAVREASNAGASQLPPADILDSTGKQVARISYNGRVWDMAGKEIDVTKSPLGGAIETKTPAEQAKSAQNNSRAAFEAAQKAAGLPPLPTKETLLSKPEGGEG